MSSGELEWVGSLRPEVQEHHSLSSFLMSLPSTWARGSGRDIGEDVAVLLS